LDVFNPTAMERGLPHVLLVSNHVQAKQRYSCAGVFVDRQLASLRNAGAHITTFDIGISHSPVHILRKCVELRRLVRQLKPDLVHGRYGTIVGFVAACGARASVISFCGGDLLPGASVSRVRLHLGFLLSNLAALRAKALICMTEELRQTLWWGKERAIVIPDGVDLDLFSPGSQEDARKELGWDFTDPVVIFNDGKDPKLKGLDVAQAALEKARRRVPNLKLYVISDVKPARMPFYYRAADVLLCASITEGSPNVVKEALACNLPVVSTPVGDVPERLAGVYPSAIVPRDPMAIGDALAQIVLTRERSNGREHITHLGLNEVAQRVLTVYRSVLMSGPRSLLSPSPLPTGEREG
jgi:teichuronic acid biosynthesis glycosyltransferase TuaC